MSKLKTPALTWAVAGFALVVLVVGGTLTAEAPRGLKATEDGEVMQFVNHNLPPIPRGPMTVTADTHRALSILSFDDGSCESGLGAGVTVTSYVNFDVPTQCIQSGLEIVGLTTRMNSGSGQAFALGQAGATPPAAFAGQYIPVTTIPPFGPCPATTMTTRAISPGAAVITGTANFFAGVQNTGFLARDTNGPSAFRIWLACATCGMTQYSPTDLTSIGLGGNWLLRVTVEDANCVPVELMNFTVN